MMRLAAILLAFVPLADDARIVDVHVVNDEVLCTVKARHAGVDELLRDLAAKSKRELFGLDANVVFDPIEVDMVDRPLDLAVDALAGAAGLRAQVKATSITVRPDLDDSASIEQLEDMAEVMFVRAVRRFPDADGAAGAELALGEIQESRHNDTPARSHYDTLVRAHPDSPLVSEGLKRAAVIHQRHAEWSEAAANWSSLANRPPPNPYAVKARVELARCQAFAGDGRQALALIEALDRTMPPDSEADRADRAYVRAAALVASDRGADALTALDGAMALGLDQASLADSVRLRADALDHAGMPGDAARSWLAFASKNTGDVRRTACLNAARSAAKAGDSLGVLFIERVARGSGAEDQVKPFADAARDQLGFTVKKTDMSVLRLTHAEELCAAGNFEETARALDSVWRDRANLSESDLTRAVRIHARCTDHDAGVDAAIGELRTALQDIQYPENRRVLYLLAGELYEHREQWELAARAYGGQL